MVSRSATTLSESRLAPAWRALQSCGRTALIPYLTAGYPSVQGGIDAIDFSRVGEVRLADCTRLGKEEHLQPGTGDMDFGRLFKRCEESGFKGFSSGTLKETWGILAGNTGVFEMDEMEVPAENLLGK